MDVAVPDSHNSAGIPNADFVVYLTANEADHGSTMAAGACVWGRGVCGVCIQKDVRAERHTSVPRTETLRQCPVC